MHGANANIRTPYDWEITVMREMGWSWNELMATPDDVLAILLEHISAERRWMRERQRREEAKARSKKR